MDDWSALKSEAEKYSDVAIEVRRHLHRHPELSFREHGTTAYLMQRLESLGFSGFQRITETGFYFDIDGKEPGKNILIRADIDALPIQETEGRPYGSCVPGVMHACGHDVHTACVFLTAIILKKYSKNFNGKIRVVFQPGEEKSPGGASVMIEKGLLHNPGMDMALALHVHPDLPVGKAGFCSGPFMAASDEIFIEVYGKGGHAALKDKYTNPIPAASQIITELTRFFSDKEDIVFAIGKVQANGATNVIPDACFMEGTLRSFDDEARKQAKILIRERVQEIAKMFGCKATFKTSDGYPVLINHPELTQNCLNIAKEVLGDENVVVLPRRYTAEDFAFISQRVPSCFFRLGVSNYEKGISAPVHTPQFDADEACIPIGASLLAAMCLHELHHA